MGTFVKKNKLNNSSKWFTFGQKLDRTLQAAVFLRAFKNKKSSSSKLYNQSGNPIVVNILMAIVIEFSKPI